jgi:hypothetical protein
LTDSWLINADYTFNTKMDYFARRGFTMKKLIILALVTLITIPAVILAQWGPDVRLTYDSNNSSTIPSKSVAAEENIVHAVWRDTRDGNYEIYYKRSTDNGGTWGPDKRLTSNADYSFNPVVAVSGSNVHVVWFDNRSGNYEIYYKRSTDNGGTWGTDIRLTDDPGSSFHPCVAVSGSNVHVAWRDERDENMEIYYKRSTDNGGSWGGDVRLTDDNATSKDPTIAVSGSNVHVIWSENRDGNPEVYYKLSTDNGATWGKDTRLTDDPALTAYPCVTALSNNVHVVWRDMRDGNDEIYYKRSTDNGGTWGADARLTNYSAIKRLPSVAASGSNIHVVWNDYRDNREIYYKLSTDNGATWGTDTRLTDDPANSYNPSVAASGSHVHVVWYDYRDGNPEVYYKNNAITGIETPSFFATSEFSSIKLQWRLEVEHQIIQYLIHKKSVGEGEDYSEIARIPACGSSPSPQTYLFRDRDVKSGIRYFYKLGAVTIDGNTRWYGPVAATVIAEKPLLEISPNPFSTATTISLRGVSDYQSTRISELQIFDVTGRRVREISLLPFDFSLTVTWDGRDDYAKHVSPGIYFVRLRSGDYTAIEKVLLAR